MKPARKKAIKPTKPTGSYNFASASPEEEAPSEWRRFFTPMSEVKATPPEWIIKNMLVPGLNLWVGPPKVFKSTLVLETVAMVQEGVINPSFKGFVKVLKRGPVVYFAMEQNAGTIKHAYEKRILKRSMRKGVVSWDFVLPNDAWLWQIDEPAPPYDIVAFIEEWKPLIVVLDPLVYFHSLDENDPQMVRPLVPLRKAVLSYGGALLVIHHARKRQGQEVGGKIDLTAGFDSVRGTSALWAMADAGMILTRMSGGAINLMAQFKDHPGFTRTWRPSGT